ncbi:Hypothetical predicted protein [Mytilus galloprovincialis]|uniref:Uncharacterized protein n=1 Tax=Mytilus galloprovincialis TaxID=29158 RepID=A0A8B6DVF5_MYTGA|nr:Hypothetical predicted protein [Mytilus galloprovincialis]
MYCIVLRILVLSDNTRKSHHWRLASRVSCGKEEFGARHRRHAKQDAETHDFSDSDTPSDEYLLKPEHEEVKRDLSRPSSAMSKILDYTMQHGDHRYSSKISRPDEKKSLFQTECDDQDKVQDFASDRQSKPENIHRTDKLGYTKPSIRLNVEENIDSRDYSRHQATQHQNHSWDGSKVPMKILKTVIIHVTIIQIRRHHSWDGSKVPMKTLKNVIIHETIIHISKHHRWEGSKDPIEHKPRTERPVPVPRRHQRLESHTPSTIIPRRIPSPEIQHRIRIPSPEIRRRIPLPEIQRRIPSPEIF